MAQLNMVQAINLALRQEMERDDRVVIIGEDVGIDGGVFRVTEGLQERFGSERVIDTPLSESAITGTAIGMAAYGLRPVAEIQFLGFLYGAMEQFFSHAARIRARSPRTIHRADGGAHPVRCRDQCLECWRWLWTSGCEWVSLPNKA